MNTDPSMPAATPAFKPLDAVALARLLELDPDGQHGVVQRVLATFDTSLRRLLGQLEAQAERPQAAAVSAIAHTLKSSSASVGALDLAAVCAEVEARLRGGDASALSADVQRLLIESRAALLAVAAKLQA